MARTIVHGAPLTVKVSVHTTRNKGYFNSAKDISDAAVLEIVLLECARRLAPCPGSAWVQDYQET